MNSLKTADDFNLIHLELSDVQKNIEKSTISYKLQKNNVAKIFAEIRRVLNIKYNDSSNIKGKTLDF